MLTVQEKEAVFGDVVEFVGRSRTKPIVVINSDDPSRSLWESLCATHRAAVQGIEYTSHEQQLQFDRDMYLGIMRAGKSLVIEGKTIRTEQELDALLEEHMRKSGDRPRRSNEEL